MFEVLHSVFLPYNVVWNDFIALVTNAGKRNLIWFLIHIVDITAT